MAQNRYYELYKLTVTFKLTRQGSVKIRFMYVHLKTTFTGCKPNLAASIVYRFTG